MKESNASEYYARMYNTAIQYKVSVVVEEVKFMLCDSSVCCLWRLSEEEEVMR